MENVNRRAGLARDLAVAWIAIWGVALACLAALDWAGYQGFLLSLVER
jgi:hypothetical protein